MSGEAPVRQVSVTNKFATCVSVGILFVAADGSTSETPLRLVPGGASRDLRFTLTAADETVDFSVVAYFGGGSSAAATSPMYSSSWSFADTTDATWVGVRLGVLSPLLITLWICFGLLLVAIIVFVVLRMWRTRKDGAKPAAQKRPVSGASAAAFGDVLRASLL